MDLSREKITEEELKAVLKKRWHRLIPHIQRILPTQSELEFIVRIGLDPSNRSHLKIAQNACSLAERLVSLAGDQVILDRMRNPAKGEADAGARKESKQSAE